DRGHGRRGPSKGVIDRKLESVQRWNVKASLSRMPLPQFQLVLIRMIRRQCVKNGTLWMSRCKELPDGTEQWVDDEGRSRYERISCLDSRETCRTWYGTREELSSFDYQQQINNIENTLRMEVEELRTEARRRDSEMDELRREL
ncbi:hypothetical protein Taro_034991, partial [Colocasia esculenta]|nr:hypothetical protein [Colocasia esculenta]